MTRTIEEIMAEVAELKQIDPDYSAFGAEDHQYRFPPPLSETALQTFESAHRCQLPRDYRNFLIQVGNGGAGPYFGLLPLNVQKPVDFRFEDEQAMLDLGSPFPYQEAWNADWVKEHDFDLERPDDGNLESYWLPSHIRGSLPICHFGHGDAYLLVLNGPEAGHIWVDGRGNYSGVFPLELAGERIGFLDWYGYWLDHPKDYYHTI